MSLGLVFRGGSCFFEADCAGSVTLTLWLCEDALLLDVLEALLLPVICEPGACGRKSAALWPELPVPPSFMTSMRCAGKPVLPPRASPCSRLLGASLALSRICCLRDELVLAASCKWLVNCFYCSFAQPCLPRAFLPAGPICMGFRMLLNSLLRSYVGWTVCRFAANTLKSGPAK